MTTFIRGNKVNRELNFSAIWPLRCHTASQKKENFKKDVCLKYYFKLEHTGDC